LLNYSFISRQQFGILGKTLTQFSTVAAKDVARAHAAVGRAEAAGEAADENLIRIRSAAIDRASGAADCSN